MPRIRFEDSGKVVEWEADKPLLQCAIESDIEISHICDGDGACGTCRSEIIEGWKHLNPPTPDETYKDIEAPYRLSCQARASGDIVLRIAKIE